MKISVIVPVYNVENYLEKCLNSLVNQTLQEIEILVINDGSTDNSQKIIEFFQSKFPQKIKTFAKENGGLSDARNFGIDRATGEFLAFVDSDDYVSATMMEEMYGLAKKHEAEIVICNLQKVDENGIVTQKLTQIPNLPEKIDLEKHFSVFSDISYFACNKIFKRELFEGKRFQKGMHFEDIELIPKILLQCKIDGLKSEISEIESIIQNKDVALYPFEKIDEETSNLSDDEYRDLVELAKKHCFRNIII